jgi:cation diffusion facilitator family transporter
MDLVASVIAFIAVRISARRPDQHHHFGHGKVEDISALAEALLIFIAAIWIIYEAVQKLIKAEPLVTVDLGIGVMLISVILNIIVSHMLLKVGKKTESPALIADAWHLRTDVYTSAGVFGGLSLIWIIGKLSPGADVHWIDPVVAIAVAILIMYAAYNLTRDAVNDLVDSSPPQAETMWLSRYLTGWYPTVRSVHRVRARKTGATRFIDLHIVVEPAMTVSASHEITEKMTAEIRDYLKTADITVHIEPCDGSCKKSCISGCLLTEKERKTIQQKAFLNEKR